MGYSGVLITLINSARVDAFRDESGADALDGKLPALTRSSKDRIWPWAALARRNVGSIRDGVNKKLVAACIPAVSGPPTVRMLPIDERLGRYAIRPYVWSCPGVP